MHQGRIIAFSGVDGAGKSTQIGLLEQVFDRRGDRVIRFWARGGYTPLFSAAKALVRRVRPGALPPPGQSSKRNERLASKRVRRVWLTAAMVDLAFWYGVWLRWQRWRGRVVLCDRYLDDTLLDFRRNFPTEEVEHWLLWRLLRWLTPEPDATLLLLLPVPESQRRCREKHEPFPDTEETLVWRLEQYRLLAETDRWHEVDAQQAVDAVHTEVRRAVGV